MCKKASFRFYGPLNDFLPEQRRTAAFNYSYQGSPSVKDAIQALGIPHTEVALILANSHPVNFDYPIEPEDMISVYPAFRSFDVSAVSRLSNAPLQHSRFIADVHLGKLARYLRMLGFDVFYNPEFTDKDIIRLSGGEKRIILTRARALLKHNAVVYGYYLRSQEYKRQVAEVLDHFGLKGRVMPFTRCMDCNGRLNPVEKDKIKDQLEPLTRANFNEFYQCENCHKTYWQGSHSDRMKVSINHLIDS